jgi:hypothetical protein
MGVVKKFIYAGLQVVMWAQRQAVESLLLQDYRAMNRLLKKNLGIRQTEKLARAQHLSLAFARAGLSYWHNEKLDAYELVALRRRRNTYTRWLFGRKHWATGGWPVRLMKELGPPQ